MSEEYKYRAFISYKRNEATRVAKWLRGYLRRYRLPRGMRHFCPGKPEVYLDTTYEVATEDFFTKVITPALWQSDYLIVLLTPGALLAGRDEEGVAQNWVVREIETFLKYATLDRVIFVSVASYSFPGPLPDDMQDRYPRIGQVDLRPATRLPTRIFPGRRIWDALLNIIAKIHNVPQGRMPELRLEDARRRRAFLTTTAVGFVLICSLLVYLAVNFAHNQALAYSRLLAFAAKREALTDPELGSVLAIEAHETAATLEADDALRTALANSMGISLPLHSTSGVERVAIDVTGRLVAAGYEDGAVGVWDVQNVFKKGHARVVATLPGDGSVVTSLAFLPGTRLLLRNAWQTDKQQHLFDVWELPDVEGEPRRVFQGNGSGYVSNRGDSIAVVGVFPVRPCDSAYRN